MTQPVTNLAAILSAHPSRAEAVAVLVDPDADDPTAITYSELAGTVDRLARYLSGRHLRGERVGVLGENTPNYLSVVLAAASAGLVALPMSPRQGAAQLAAIIEEAKPSAVFTDDPSLLPAGTSVLPLHGSEFAELDGPAAEVAAGDDAIAVQLYTSGSSGRPKGVLLSHRAFLFTLGPLLRREPPPALAVLVAAPLFHMNGLITCFSVLAQGGRIDLMRRFDAMRYLYAIQSTKPTVLVGVPTMFGMIADAAGATPPSLDSVQAVISGSATLTDELRERIHRLFPMAQVVNSYGTTEAFGIFGPDPGGRLVPPGSVGTTQPGVEVRLVDGPTEREGRLLVRTPASMSGYHKQATDSVVTDDGFYDTGDLARVDDEGFFFILGRADDLIICGGEKVYPTAVEAVLQSYPGVGLAAVVAKPDARKGQVPVAFVVPANGGDIDAKSLKNHCLAHGPAYAHPRQVHVLSELPMTSTGKIDKKRLTRVASGDDEL
jgi:acyl-CoA synthetase (AMP-forming)/AMP-acid ligase II